MGPPDKQPALPKYQWCMQPDAEQSTASKWMQDSNYAQALEGNIDSSHITFLHRTVRQRALHHAVWSRAPQQTDRCARDGVRLCLRRPPRRSGRPVLLADDDLHHADVHPDPESGARGGGIFVIPRDDETHWWITVRPPQPRTIAEPQRSLDECRHARPVSGASVADPATLGLIPGTWRHVRNKDNDYMIDRHMQKTFNYSGLPGNRVQDMAVTESMGADFRSVSEHLGAADTAIIVMRRQLLRMARELEQGIEPTMLANPDHFRTAPLAVVTRASRSLDGRGTCSMRN